MGKTISAEELVGFKELLMANSIQVNSMARLLIEKGFLQRLSFSTL